MDKERRNTGSENCCDACPAENTTRRSRKAGYPGRNNPLGKTENHLFDLISPRRLPWDRRAHGESCKSTDSLLFQEGRLASGEATCQMTYCGLAAPRRGGKRKAHSDAPTRSTPARLEIDRSRVERGFEFVPVPVSATRALRGLVRSVQNICWQGCGIPCLAEYAFPEPCRTSTCENPEATLRALSLRAAGGDQRVSATD